MKNTVYAPGIELFFLTLRPLELKPPHSPQRTARPRCPCSGVRDRTKKYTGWSDYFCIQGGYPVVSCSVGPVVGGWGADGPEKGGFFPRFFPVFPVLGPERTGKRGGEQGKAAARGTGAGSSFESEQEEKAGL